MSGQGLVSSSEPETALVHHRSSSSQLGELVRAAWSSVPTRAEQGAAGAHLAVLTWLYSCDCLRNSGESCWATAMSTSQAAGTAGVTSLTGLFLWATSLQESRRWQLTQPFAPRAVSWTQQLGQHRGRGAAEPLTRPPCAVPMAVPPAQGSPAHAQSIVHVGVQDGLQVIHAAHQHGS